MIQFAVLLSAVACASSAAIPEVLLSKSNGRIVNGEPTTIDSFPYVVSVQILGVHWCGGCIIHKDWILTAGHCVFASPSYYLVLAGSTYWNEGGSEYKVKSIITHDEYSRQTLENDIALYQLETPFQYGSNIKPIPIAAVLPANGADAVAVGWGSTYYGGVSAIPELRAVELHIVLISECRSEEYGYGTIVPDGTICAIDVGKDACEGDSGGPLVSGGVLVGITSWGIECANPQFPGIYVDVPKYKEWIEGIVAGN